MSSLPSLLFLLSLTACAGELEPAPRLDYSWSIDRTTLPEVELSVMHVGLTEFSERQALQGGSRRKIMQGPLSVFVVRHAIHGVMLIDTGFGRRTKNDPKDYPGAATASATGLQMGTPAVEQLAARGIEADEIGNIVVTHLHMDHAGGIEDFPEAVLWVDRREWAAASKRRLLKSYDPVPYADHRQVRPLDLEHPHESYGPMPAHHDLFGDGTVVLLSTPGHTPGHLSVMVNTQRRSYLLTGDCAWVDAHWQGPSHKGFFARTMLEDDPTAAMQSVHRIRDWARRFPEITVIAGHEPANLTRYPTFPIPLP